MLRSVKAPQRQMKIMSAKVDGTGTASLGGTCANDMTLTDNGTGDYTLTFGLAFERIPEVVAMSSSGNIVCKIAAVSVSSVQIQTVNLSAAATDADFHVMIMGSLDVDAI